MQVANIRTTAMIQVKVKDNILRKAAESNDMDAFVNAFTDAINDAIGGQLTQENMQQLNADQITLLGWSYLHTEVMDGGYIQLIHNGYGGFIFRNPFAKAVREWGMTDLYRHLRHCKEWYDKYHEQIEQDMSDEDFMALYEQMPEFDDYDDDFIVNEEAWQAMVAAYIDGHVEQFAVVE